MPSAGYDVIFAALLAVALAAPGTAKVAFVAGSTVYVASGRTAGIATGDTLTVTRAGEWITTLRATVVTSSSVACDTVRTLRLPEPGDLVRFVPHDDSARVALAALDSARVAVRPSSPARTRHWRGSVGGQWMQLHDERTRLDQPAMDLRVEGSSLLANRMDLSLDWRASRTSRTRDTTRVVDPRSRVWRASLSMHDPDEMRRIVVGRQTSASVATVSLFDGALIEGGTPRMRLGAFAGTQPEPVQMHYSTKVAEYGGYLEWRQPPLSARRWTATVGGVSSFDGGEPNRDFGYLQASYMTRKLSGWLSQELDLNRGWKRAAEGAPVTLTSTFASTRIDLRHGVSLNAGYDSRRNVRLWRDRLTPETDFDDGTREGAWLGSAWRPARWFALDGEMRTRHGDAGRGNGWSAGGELRRGGRGAVALRARTAAFRDERIDSRLASMSLGADLVSAVHVEGSGGSRRTRDLTFGSSDEQTWINLSADATLSRRLWLTGSVERTRGDLGTTTLDWFGLRWRF